MPPQLLPTEFEEYAANAVKTFWNSRGTGGPTKQGGSRDAVTSGKNMDGFVNPVRVVATFAGIPATAIHTRSADVVLPGYFRATKNWDVLVIHRRRLLAVFEFKSQVGSLGKNGNNRSEEVIGAAADLWVAHNQGVFSEIPPSNGHSPVLAGGSTPQSHPEIQRDPRPPFLGWLMLMEDSADARQTIGVREPHFKVFPEFRGASYAKRYQILCERLVERKLYGAAALVLSNPTIGAATGDHCALSDATSLRTLFAEFSGKMLASLSSSG